MEKENDKILKNKGYEKDKYNLSFKENKKGFKK
jgi:hypothetical protein